MAMSGRLISFGKFTTGFDDKTRIGTCKLALPLMMLTQISNRLSTDAFLNEDFAVNSNSKTRVSLKSRKVFVSSPMIESLRSSVLSNSIER